MTISSDIHYFLGAHSSSGFYSLYDQLLPQQQTQDMYILKGGIGCGKSTFLSHVAEQLDTPIEYIHSATDPDRLDGLRLPAYGIGLIDGTSPHVVEPKCGGALEQTVNLGSCYLRAGLIPLRDTLLSTMADEKTCHQRGHSCLLAASELLQSLRTILTAPALEEKLTRRAAGILTRELRAKKGSPVGNVTQRFLSTICHRGQVTLWDTVTAQCPRVYALEDSYGLSHTLLSHLLSGAVRGGYDVIACPDPLFPQRLSHLLIPEKGVAFVTYTPAHPYTGTVYRHIHLDAMPDSETIRHNRPRLRFYRKMSKALLDDAIDCFAQAKAHHDQLLTYYAPHVDVQQVDALADAIASALSVPLQLPT